MTNQTIQNSPAAVEALRDAGIPPTPPLDAGTILPLTIRADSPWFDNVAVGAIQAGTIGPNVRTQVWSAVLAERTRAEAKHGKQSLPLGTGTYGDVRRADKVREKCDAKAAVGTVTWRDVIAEEVYEAFAESDPQAFVAEAVQAIGTLLAAIEQAVADNPDLSLPPPF